MEGRNIRKEWRNLPELEPDVTWQPILKAQGSNERRNDRECNGKTHAKVHLPRIQTS